MTACLYISPKVFSGDKDVGFLPVLIADTMVTLQSIKDYELKSEEITPSRDSYFTSGHISHSQLARKIAIVDRAAFAFAGDLQGLDAFLNIIQFHKSDWSTSARPMKPMGDYADQNKLQVIGAYPAPLEEGKPQGVHYVCPTSNKIELSRLGLCCTIGSGYSDLLDECRRGNQIAEENAYAFSQAYPFAMGFINQLNGKRLLSEQLGKTENAWGGYLEWVWFDYANNRWQSGPPTFHFFCVALQIPGSNTFTSAVLSKSLGYFNVGKTSFVLSIDTFKSTIYELRTLALARQSSFDPALLNSSMFNNVVVTCFTAFDDFADFTSYTFDQNNLDGFQFSFHEDKISVALEERKFNFLFKQLEAMRGLTFVRPEEYGSDKLRELVKVYNASQDKKKPETEHTT